MFEGVGTVESSGQGTLRVQANPTTASTSGSGVAESFDSVPLSPRMTSDPAAGVMVMEYISDDGVMTMQLPSRTVVAYLRSGLSEAGLPIPDDFTSVNEEA